MGRGSGQAVAGPAASPRRRAAKPAPELQIETADRADIPELAALKVEVARRAYSRSHDPELVEQWVAKNCGEDHFRYRIGRSGYSVLVARRKGKIVGVATMRKRGDRADMSGLYVLEPGQGIGSELVARREDLTREQGCTRTRASVFRSNEEGKSFVLRRGLERTGKGFREPVFGVVVDHYEGDL